MSRSRSLHLRSLLLAGAALVSVLVASASEAQSCRRWWGFDPAGTNVDFSSVCGGTIHDSVPGGSVSFLADPGIVRASTAASYVDPIEFEEGGIAYAHGDASILDLIAWGPDAPSIPITLNYVITASASASGVRALPHRHPGANRGGRVE